MRLTNDNALGLVISRTGETSTVCHAAQRTLDRTDATVVGFAHKPLNIDRQPATGDDDGDEDRYWYIPLPDVTERVEHYATRSALLQMAVLHTVVLAADPDQDALDQVFQHVEEFIQNQLDWAPANPDEGDPTPPALQAVIEIEDRHYFLARQSPFMRAATALSQEGDLGDDLVFANLGPWH